MNKINRGNSINFKSAIIAVILLISLICLICCELAYAAPITEEPQNSVQPQEPEQPQETPVQPQTPNGSTGNGNGESSQGTGTPSSGTSAVDTRLKNLEISCGQLVPEFSPDIYSYTVYVSRDAQDKSCMASAEAVEASTVISAEGPSEFDDEDVRKTIRVEGNDGSKSEYVIDVHVLKDTEVLVENALYTIAEPEAVDNLPGKFEVINTEYKGHKIKAAKSRDGNLILLCFASAHNDEDILWYMLGSDKESIYPVQIKEIDGKYYISIASDGELTYGDGGYLLFGSSGDVLFALSDADKNESSEDSIFENKYFSISLIVALVVCIILCAYVLSAKKKTRNKNDSPAKYFRPYMHLNDGVNEIVGEIEETHIGDKES